MQKEPSVSDLPRRFYRETYNPLKAGSIDGTDVKPHDHAVYRAMHAHYSPDKDPKQKGDPYCTLFVARLSHHTTEEQLKEIFEKWGKIKHIRLVRDIVTGFPRGYAFITYYNERDFWRAYKEAHRMVINGTPILVDYERERITEGWIPRRLGGGLSGKKESGQLRFGGREKPFRKPLTLSMFRPTQNPNDPSVHNKIGVIARIKDEETGKDVVLHMKYTATGFQQREI